MDRRLKRERQRERQAGRQAGDRGCQRTNEEASPTDSHELILIGHKGAVSPSMNVLSGGGRDSSRAESHMMPVYKMQLLVVVQLCRTAPNSSCCM